MSKEYSPVLDRIAHIEAACADIRRDLASAASVAAANAADTEGQSEEDTVADAEVTAFEAAARGHFGDIKNHVEQALALTWGSPATPSGPVVSPVVSPETVPTPAAVSPPGPAVSPPGPADSAAPAAPAAPADGAAPSAPASPTEVTPAAPST